jgi:hypothetical protein
MPWEAPVISRRDPERRRRLIGFPLRSAFGHPVSWHGSSVYFDRFRGAGQVENDENRSAPDESRAGWSNFTHLSGESGPKWDWKSAKRRRAEDDPDRKPCFRRLSELALRQWFAPSRVSVASPFRAKIGYGFGYARLGNTISPWGRKTKPDPSRGRAKEFVAELAGTRGKPWRATLRQLREDWNLRTRTRFH